VAQHQQLGLLSGAVVEGCEGEVDQESEARVNDKEEHGPAADRSRSGRAAAEFGWTVGTPQAVYPSRLPRRVELLNQTTSGAN
jgi:hypothetical protein